MYELLKKKDNIDIIFLNFLKGSIKMGFDAVKVKNDIVEWIKNWFEKNGKGCNAVVGISGGKDSSIVAALCAEALGRDRVYGVLMPKGEQPDFDVSLALVKHLGIKYFIINIQVAFDAIVNEMQNQIEEISAQSITNLPPRIRMTTLYAVSQSLNGRVANTSNLSEDWVGYCTKFGDAAGDFSPLSRLTVQEVKEIGRVLGLPSMFVDKTPIDGLCGKTDEDNLGFTYALLDKYIRTGVCDDNATKERIDTLNRNNKFKLEPLPTFPYSPE